MKQEALLQYLPFWKDLSNQQRTQIAAYSVWKTLQKNEVLYSPLHDCQGIFIIQTGLLQASLLSPDGKQGVLFQIREQEFCILTGSCLLSQLKMDVELIAETDTTILLITLAILQELIKQECRVEQFLLEKIAQRFQHVVMMLQRITSYTLKQRLVMFLMEETHTLNSSVLYMTHEEIAKHIMSSREVISRTLKELEKQGVCNLSRGKVVLDMEQLQKLVAFE